MGLQATGSDRPTTLLQVSSSFFEGAVLYWESDGCQNHFQGKLGSDSHGPLSLRKQEDVERAGAEEDDDDEKQEGSCLSTATAAAAAAADPPSSSPSSQRGSDMQPAFEAGSLYRWACSTCGCLDFSSLQDQRSHFKSDFHRFNVKRRLIGKEAVTEEQFEALVHGQQLDNDDISSISGSDEEDGSSDTDTACQSQLSNIRKLTRQSHISLLLQNGDELVQVWRCVLMGDKEQLIRGMDDSRSLNEKQGFDLTEDELMHRLRSFVDNGQADDRKIIWVILLSRGGHFAGCVFDACKGSVITHKTHHRYVVRAKAGGKQSTKDATGRAPKSAGASLRRHNEGLLQREIKEVLMAWKSYLQTASCIFVHAPSSNSNVFFRGEDAPINRNDRRVRHVPVTTRRPTFKEAKRIFSELIALQYERLKYKDISDELNSSGCGGLLSITEDTCGSHKDTDVPIRDSSLTPETLPIQKSSMADATSGIVSTPLHDAAKSGNTHLVLQLLEEGADPCVKDVRGRTPYTVASDRETRNIFRRFMANHLELWDWHGANVPSALTEEMEIAQAAKQAEKEAKRKAKAKEQKKLRIAKQKAQAQNGSSQQLASLASELVCHGEKDLAGPSLKAKQKTSSAAVNDAVKRAEALEREKRAAAAEKRIHSMTHGLDGSHRNTANVMSSDVSGHCSCCGVSLAGKVPFFRFSYQYCSTACVDVHRLTLEGK